MFEFQVSPRILFGRDRASELEGVLDNLGSRRALVVTDKGLVAAGVLRRVIPPKLDGRVITYDAVKPDPALDQIDEIAEFASSEAVDCIIGVGGGSSIDCAKAVIARLSVTGAMRDFAGPFALQGKLGSALPFVAVPTTAGTGSEVTKVAVITDLETKRKLGFMAAELLPRVAILDPALLAGTPRHIAAWSGLDALTHAIEAFVGKRANAFSDGMAREAIRLIGEHLTSFVADGSDVRASAGMMAASCMAGIAFGHASVGLVHAIAHPIGTHFHVPHGLACGILLPHVTRFSMPGNADRFAEIHELLKAGKSGESDLAAYLLGISDSVGLPRSLTSLGYDVQPSNVVIAEARMQPFYSNNPRAADDQDIANIISAVA